VIKPVDNNIQSDRNHRIRQRVGKHTEHSNHKPPAVRPNVLQKPSINVHESPLKQLNAQRATFNKDLYFRCALRVKQVLVCQGNHCNIFVDTAQGYDLIDFNTKFEPYQPRRLIWLTG